MACPRRSPTGCRPGYATAHATRSSGGAPNRPCAGCAAPRGTSSARARQSAARARLIELHTAVASSALARPDPSRVASRRVDLRNRPCQIHLEIGALIEEVRNPEIVEVQVAAGIRVLTGVDRHARARADLVHPHEPPRAAAPRARPRAVPSPASRTARAPLRPIAPIAPIAWAEHRPARATGVRRGVTDQRGRVLCEIRSQRRILYFFARRLRRLM